MERVKFGEYITVDKEVFKVCPQCKEDIKPEWKHAYEHEWCPACGLNLDVIKEEENKSR